MTVLDKRTTQKRNEEVSKNMTKTNTSAKPRTTKARINSNALMLLIAWVAAIVGGIVAIVQSSRVTALANELKAQEIKLASVSAPADTDTASDDIIIPCSLYSLPEKADYNGMKSYESYTAITDKTSAQYAIQTMAWTNKDAFRMVGDRYLVAVGTYFNAPVGTSIDIILENGTVIPCIVGDIKADEHTDFYGVYSSNGCATEFIVDATTTKANITGDVSTLYAEWQSKVSYIRVYDNVNILSENNNA